MRDVAMKFIDATKIAEIARRAAEDVELRMQIVYCPEKVVHVWDLSPEEAYIIRTGDLSRVLLDEETMELARAMFEIPAAGLADVRSSYRVWGQFGDVRSSSLCT